MRKSIILWMVSVSTAAAISAGVTAQVRSNRSDQPRVLSGADVGFRVHGQRREMRTDTTTGRKTPIDMLVGQLVVRVNGEWVEVKESVGPTPLTQ